MRFVPTELPEVVVVEPQVFGDERGFFMETWHAEKFAAGGLDVRFVQDNHSRSAQGILRGLHYQLTRPQGKLVRVVAGEIFDVAVDLRRSSPTFGRWVGVTLSAENRRQLWVPAGFAHGFYVTGDCAEVVYKCSDLYQPSDEYSLAWNDPAVGIRWPLAGGHPPVLSAKDATGRALADSPTYP